MASNNEFTATVECFEIEFNGDSPLLEDEVWVTFVSVKPEHPEEEEIIPIRVDRSLLSYEESAKAIIPIMLSRTTLPELFHHCPVFIGSVSQYFCNSLPSDAHHVFVYNHVVWDVIDPRKSVRSFCLSTVELSRTDTDKLVMMSRRRRSEMNGGAIALLEAAVQAKKKVKFEEAWECAICLQGLMAGVDAVAKLACSHVYHRGCIGKWLHRSNQCPLCRSNLSNSIV
jgi:hypothetical protein